MKIRIALLTCSLLILMTAHAQPFNRAKMDSLFDQLAANNLAIGSLAVSSGDRIIYQRSFGKDQSSETAYRIGSITKVFTAVLIYQLIENKRIALTDSLSSYFPQLPHAGKITIAELLGHRSGLANFTNHTDYDNWKTQPKTEEELLAMIKNQPSDFAPNAKADYNNSNYLLLGYVIEKIYRKPYKEIVAEKIIKKIGLEHTYYGDHAGFGGKEAISYKYFNNEWKQEKAVYLNNFGGAGAIISPPADMCKFIHSIFTYRLVGAQSVKKMTTIIDGYGMGMFPYGSDAHPGFGHNGKTEGFGSSLSYYPENKLSIAYCTNGEVYPKAAILDAVFKICFNQPYVLPTFSAVEVGEKQLEPCIGSYSSADSSINVLCAIKDGQLQIETMGQQFKVRALSDHLFWNIPFGFFFEFNNDGKQLLIKDVDAVYELYKR